MSFFRHPRNACEAEEYRRLDTFVFDVGAATDDIIREVVVGGLVSIRARKLQEALITDASLPGYRETLNRLRAEYGLSRL